MAYARNVMNQWVINMAVQQGIYCAPDSVVPNRDRADVGCAPNGVMKLWVVEFNLYGMLDKGCAVIKAANPKAAIDILKSSGMYNGSPEKYLVTRVEEIIVPPCSGLMAEQIVSFDEK
ncbi:hypothetical protein [uncultured phage cr106_1]|uniref:Uncharacterized protein n=1 Tax=uncultured phage cr106_1 TaxID=2772062 RepID=A0A7M1RV97_9CAUD|nr:hypothetical protein KNV29_gp054 [uncultured phage cr106_1]QOR58333.1 hypothetical protein [uncultured phage cr106_1]